MSARDKLAEIISDAENCTDEEGSWALPEDVADAVVAAGWRPPAREITTVEELEALPNNEERAIPQEALEAACNAFQRPNRMLVNTSDGNLKGRLEAAFEVALPHIEKEIRAQVAAELRGELPVQLAETAESDTGWLYDMSDWGPCPSEGNEHVDFRDENGFNIGSIDLHLIAAIAAGIAEGTNNA